MADPPEADLSGGHEWSALMTFGDGTTMLHGVRCRTAAMGRYEAACILAKHPPNDEPEPGDLVDVTVVCREVGPWLPAAAGVSPEVTR